ncbi:hypothetical protein E8E13_003065 [Curvularia kusanoi]|uniref:Heterokaryon incompatibility domain-containing protein n=1 Tax=Curvularia kusanoi TaxID=90978 RepID=A0A9P4WAA1_CURKU|nr:hypothetical protein E8E13_003065 [Curvularia kusanoi]
MRLLQIDNEAGDAFSLVEFIGDDVPPYAILSHTWSQTGGEVSYRDFVEGTGVSKMGYDKIRACGVHTAKKGLRYFWVDTCCIDKTSSAELSEAINSMFRWYQKAAICFAYLDDVPPGLSISEWQAANIRWFSRGWTLQELVAPSEVEFYASDWTFVGTKSEDCSSLSKITKIHMRALRGWDLEQFSIAQRMSWASSRKTTRSEDVAYCLLGLFDVNMPLLYGEGGTKAFVRLQEKIMRGSDDQSLFAWNRRDTQAHHVHGLLAQSPVYFESAGNIVALERSKISVPYSVTNSGLRISLMMAPMIIREYVAILGCKEVSFDTVSMDGWAQYKLFGHFGCF